MRKWLFSLQFKLVLGFVVVLTLALRSVSFYVGFAAQRENQQFGQELEEARADRIQAALTRLYSEPRGWVRAQTMAEQAGDLYGWRVVVTDKQGRIVGDSHPGFSVPKRPRSGGKDFVPIVSDGTQVGSFLVDRSDVPVLIQEPQLCTAGVGPEPDACLAWPPGWGALCS